MTQPAPHSFVLCVGLSALILAISACEKSSSTSRLTPKVVHAGQRVAAAASGQPSSAQQEAAWQLLRDFVQVADASNTNPKSGAFGSDEKQQWQPACLVPKDTCVDLDSLTSTARPKRTAPAKQSNQAELSAHLTDALASTGTSIPHAAAVILTSEPTVVLYNTIAAEGARVCKPDKASSCPGGLTLPFYSMIGRFTWAGIPAGKCPTIANLLGPEASTKNIGRVEIAPNLCAQNGKTPVIPVSNFFHVTVSDNNLGIFRTSDQTLLQKGDEAVLLGFHLIEKMKTQKTEALHDATWTWATFWWVHDPQNAAGAGISCGTAASGCPQSFSDWSHYVMNTTASEPDVYFQPVSNPFVDRGNVNANCIICHKYAFTPQSANANSTSSLCGGQNPTSLKPDALDSAATTYQTSCTPARVSTDMIWTLAEPSIAQSMDLQARLQAQRCSSTCTPPSPQK